MNAAAAFGADRVEQQLYAESLQLLYHLLLAYSNSGLISADTQKHMI